MSYSEQKKVLEEFKRVVGQELHNLKEWPEILWQQMYNRLQWVDNKENGPVSKVINPELEKRITPGTKPWLKLKNILFESSKTILLTLKGHGDSINACAFSPDNNSILSAGADRTLRLWDLDTGKELKTFKYHDDEVTCCAFSPDGKYIVSGSKDETLKLWNADTCEETARLEGHQDAVNSCAFSPDGTIIVSGSDDGSVIFWDTRTKQELEKIDISHRPVTCCTFSPDGDIVAAASEDGMLTLIDSENFEELSFTSAMKSLNCCAFGPDGEVIVTGGYTGNHYNEPVIFYRTEDDEPEPEEPFEYTIDEERHAEDITACGFSPDGSLVVTGGVDNYLMLWDAVGFEFSAKLAGHSAEITSCIFSPDGKMIASTSKDCTIKIWNTENAQNESAYEDVFSDSISCCAFSPDGSKVVAGSLDRSLIVYNVSNGNFISEIKGMDVPVTSCTISPDGNILAIGDSHSKLFLWNITNNRQILCRSETFSVSEEAAINCCAFSPDSSKVVTASGIDPDAGEGSVIVWDLHNTGKYEILAQNAAWSACDFSPDGKKIIFGGDNINVWEIERQDIAKIIRNLESWVIYCAFSADGEKIISVDAHGIVQLWDTETYEELSTVNCNIRNMSSCAFSYAERFIALADFDGKLEIRAVENNRITAIYPAIGPLTCCDFNSRGFDVCCGDKAGNFYLFSLIGVDSDISNKNHINY